MLQHGMVRWQRNMTSLRGPLTSVAGPSARIARSGLSRTRGAVLGCLTCASAADGIARAGVNTIPNAWRTDSLERKA